MDLQNPLTVYEDLQFDGDGFLSLFSNESDHMPLLLSFHPSDFRFSTRQTALSLIHQAKFSYGLDPFLVYLSVNYVDRYLSKQEILDKRPWIPQILVVASLSLAAKMTNSNSSILLTVLQSEGGFEFDAQSVNRMEKIILAALQWRMRSITPFSFLRYFLTLLNIQDSSFTQSLNTRASDIISCIQHELKFLEYKPSIIATSALLCAIHDLNPLALSSSKSTFSSCEYVNNSALLECLGIMMESMSGTSTPASVSERQRTSSTSENEEEEEENNVKRRRINALCVDNRTFQISQIQQC